MMDSFVKRLRKRLSSRFARFGLPFVSMLVAGSYGLQYFSSLRYEFRNSKLMTEEEAMSGIRKPTKVTSLEEEYEKIKDSDLENWENIRGPRPWEDSKTFQAEQRAALARGEKLP